MHKCWYTWWASSVHLLVETWQRSYVCKIPPVCAKLAWDYSVMYLRIYQHLIWICSLYSSPLSVYCFYHFGVQSEDIRYVCTWLIITPCACTGVKIGCVVVVIVVVVVVVVDTKIAKSGDLGIWVSCMGNISVEFGEKLASARLNSSGMAYRWHK